MTIIVIKAQTQTTLPTDQKIRYGQIKEKVVALISEALVHDEGKDDQCVSHDHHDHQGRH